MSEVNQKIAILNWEIEESKYMYDETSSNKKSTVKFDNASDRAKFVNLRKKRDHNFFNPIKLNKKRYCKMGAEEWKKSISLPFYYLTYTYLIFFFLLICVSSCQVNGKPEAENRAIELKKQMNSH